MASQSHLQDEHYRGFLFNQKVRHSRCLKPCPANTADPDPRMGQLPRSKRDGSMLCSHGQLPDQSGAGWRLELAIPIDSKVLCLRGAGGWLLNGKATVNKAVSSTLLSFRRRISFADPRCAESLGLLVGQERQ